MKIGVRGLSLSLGVFAFAAFAVGCQKERSTPSSSTDQVSDRNVVRSGNPKIEKQIGDSNTSLTVLGLGSFDQKLADAKIAPLGTETASRFLSQLDGGKVGEKKDTQPKEPAPSTTQVPPQKRPADTLLLGMPIGLIGEQSLFGGVVVKVSNTKSDTLGRLKLMDLKPIHVRSQVFVSSSGKTAQLALIGCLQSCSETSRQIPLLGIPITGVDADKKMVILDLASLGDNLNLVKIMDPTGGYTHLKTVSSKTAGFDFSESTLVFDIETHMLPNDLKPTDPIPAETVFTTRWYLKLNSASNPAFTARPATPGVGYFMTQRSAEPKITRFSATNFAGSTVKYYLKSVPTEYQPVLAKAFDAWNDQFETQVGRKLLSYEFIPVGDPRNDLLVTGDIRYNIVEWDLVNLAPYGGLGPSIANQFTGETLSANVLLQGPTIMKMYKEWFKVSEKVQALRTDGKSEAAEQLLHDFTVEMDALQASRTSASYQLSLGENLAFSSLTQSESLHDPLMQRNDFDEIPTGSTFDSYMPGYLLEMLTHELGHNMGLRHNFRGNLGATSDTEEGKVSRSVMEYLGKRFRYVDRLSSYDVMAIGYGYSGKQPDHLDWFCTDEDAVSADAIGNSAECTSDDATSDPFSFFEARLARSIDYLVARDRTSAPTWIVTDMDRELNIATNGLLYYAATSEKSAKSFTNFFGKPGRPADAAGIKDYVLGRLSQQVCDPALDQIIAKKDSAEARTKAQGNLTALRARVKMLKGRIAPLQNDTISCL